MCPGTTRTAWITPEHGARSGQRQQVQQPACGLSPVLPGDRQRRGNVQIVQQRGGDRAGGVRGPVRSPGSGVQGLQIGGRRVEVPLVVFPFGAARAGSAAAAGSPPAGSCAADRRPARGCRSISPSSGPGSARRRRASRGGRTAPPTSRPGPSRTGRRGAGRSGPDRRSAGPRWRRTPPSPWPRTRRATPAGPTPTDWATPGPAPSTVATPAHRTGPPASGHRGCRRTPGPVPARGPGTTRRLPRRRCPRKNTDPSRS